MNKTKEVTYLLLRLAAAFMFIQSGGLKLFDWFGGIPAEHGGHPAVGTLPWFAGVLEVFGGSLILVGFITRPTAFLLSGMMAVAYFMAHQPQGAWPVQNGGMPAALYSFIYLFMAAYGGGDFSIDAVIRKKVPSWPSWL